MPILHIGLEFDKQVYIGTDILATGKVYAGPKKLLLWLETQLGRSGYPENTDYLRIELYRQALLQWSGQAKRLPFYWNSFEADRFATATSLLSWRDELLLAGWNFVPTPDCPERLADLAGVEPLFRQKIENPEIGAAAMGFADRFERVFQALPQQEIRVEQVVLHEPENLQAPVVQRFIQYIRKKSIPVKEMPQQGAALDQHTDLAQFQAQLLGVASGKRQARNDGSLLVLTARRDSDAAVYLAQWLAQNPETNPVFLIPELNRVLEQALIQEGFPAMGVLSASLARPSLQVLKLAPAFLWEPVDVFKVMEFVTLSLKPLDDGLALEIARVLAQKPGLFSDTWYAATLSYLEQGHVPDSAREQYEFWFSRRRYRTETSAPKRDAIELYAFLHRWALDQFKETENTTLLVLAEQARRIRDLLETLPEERLSFLELERIVRTIYEPAPVQLNPTETGHYDFVHQNGALAAPADRLVWWNCLFDGGVPAPDHWRMEERQWLQNTQGLQLDSPVLEGQRRQILGLHPVLQATRQLVLVVPQQANGAEVLPSLLWSDLEACFDRTQGFSFCLDEPAARAALQNFIQLPQAVALNCRPAALPRPYLQLPQGTPLPENPYETPTNLESLFYYPHRWFFRQQLRLYPASLLGISRDQTLLGSLAHRFFELFLQEDNCLDWDKKTVWNWIDTQAESLLEREGATLLLYGREPERNQFISRVKQAAWSLSTLLRSNNWSIYGTEQPLKGTFAGKEIEGKADLVLQRGEEWAIVDLKWSGARRRKEMIQNGEDLQLILYAWLLPPAEEWPHTAYFILQDGKMIARNKDAFSDAVVAPGIWEKHTDACQEIFARMERTFAWRREQLRRGLLELRTARTASELEALYAEELLDLLEMKSEDARWDDYKTLINTGVS